MYVHVHVVHILIRHLLKQILYYKYVFLHVVLDRRDLRVAAHIREQLAVSYVITDAVQIRH